jgi:transposase-like protein
MRFSFELRCRIVALIVAGESPQAAAAACGASRATGYRLWRRFQQGGWQALRDRPSTPKRQPLRLSAEAEAEILRWREHLLAGPLVMGPRVFRLTVAVITVIPSYEAREPACAAGWRTRAVPSVEAVTCDQQHVVLPAKGDTRAETMAYLLRHVGVASGGGRHGRDSTSQAGSGQKPDGAVTRWCRPRTKPRSVQGPGSGSVGGLRASDDSLSV